MSDGRLPDPGRGTTEASATAQPRAVARPARARGWDVPGEVSGAAGPADGADRADRADRADGADGAEDDAGGRVRPAPSSVSRRALPDPGQDSTERR